jgi:hypothetical protein
VRLFLELITLARRSVSEPVRTNLPGLNFYFDPIPTLQRVKQPVLAIFGAADPVVPPRASAEVYRKALREGGNQNVTVVVFAQADHLIALGGNGSSQFAPGYLETMTSWVKALGSEQPPALTPEGTLPLAQVQPERLAPERSSWFGRARVQLVLIGSFLVAFPSAVLVWPIAYTVRRIRKKRSETFPQRARLFGGILSGINLLILVGWVFLLGRHLSLLVRYQFVGPGFLRFLLVGLGVLSAGLTVKVVLSAVQSWRRDGQKLSARIHYSLVALAAILFLPFLLYWRLLPF